MSVTNWRSPGTIDTEAVATGTDWVNPGNAASSNDQDAVCTVAKNSKPSYWLRCSNFGFTTTDIPEGSTILGIEVDVECAAAATSAIQDTDCRLCDGSGRVGDNKALAGTWPITDTYRTHGGPADTWNAGLEDTDVRASTFGAHIYVTNISSSNRDAYVDHVRIRVYYEAGATPLTVQPASHATGSTSPALLVHLAPAGSSHGVASTTGALTIPLAAAGAGHGLASASPTLGVTPAVAGGSHALTSETPTLWVVLPPAAASHTTASTSPTVEEVGALDLVVQGAGHGLASGTPTLEQIGVIDLIVQGASHGLTSGTPALTVHLAPADSSHSLGSGSPVLRLALVAAAASHTLTSETPALEEVGVKTLGVQGASHALASGNPPLTLYLAPASCAHAHTAEEPTLQSALLLADAGHTLASTIPTLTVYLNPAACVHAHAAGNVTIGGTPTLTPQGGAHTHAAGSPDVQHVVPAEPPDIDLRIRALEVRLRVESFYEVKEI